MSGDESYVIQPTRERNISLKERGFRSTSSNPYNMYQTGTWEACFVTQAFVKPDVTQSVTTCSHLHKQITLIVLCFVWFLSKALSLLRKKITAFLERGKHQPSV